ncbi:MAG: sensor histidine kinase [Actinomycetota bacterium]|nr:sensor histidine kinase [Actinomycetota bacterium]MDQ2956300.1 sensor histidine kinase [Actinomycetota bacterium]
MRQLRTLSSQILIGVFAILLTTVVIGGLLDIRLTRQSLDRQYEERAVAVAAVVAATPAVQAAVTAGDPTRVLPALALRLASASGATYVVVSDRAGIRFSHPNPALIGKRLEEPVAVLDGKQHVGIDPGSLGRSANGKAPVLDAAGNVIGQVSVGILETQVAGQLRKEVEGIIAYAAIALAFGAVVALLMARAVKRVTFGLELKEIASLLQEREAMLHGIREGVIGVDVRNRVTIVNSEARRLLGLTSAAIGKPLASLIPSERLRDVLSGESPGPDQTVITTDALLVVNRRPVVVGGRDVGSIVTLRDRTELEALVRRMNAVTGLANALRAQEHEFTNRLHVIAGFLDLGEPEEARQYLDLIAHEQRYSAEDIRARVAPPLLAALLVAKLAVAAERGVELRIAPDAHLDAPESDGQMLMTVLGNLVDNAIDAVAEQPQPRLVVVQLQDEHDVRIIVTDNGPGVAEADRAHIFTDGFSTKPPREILRRGIGLALVQRLVHRAGGTISVGDQPGGYFEVVLPASRPTGPPPELVTGERTSR